MTKGTMPHTLESPTIKVSHLIQGYGKRVILRNIDCEVRHGEIVALIRPSGSGKTTLISTIVGMMPPKSGTVQVLGTPCRTAPCSATSGSWPRPTRCTPT